MKKLSLLTTILIALALIVSCAGTKTEKLVTEKDVTAVSDAVVTTISEPVKGDDSVVVIDAPVVTDVQIDQKFSYVYGYLLASNIVDQELPLNYRPLIQGSNDFYNYEEPLIDEHDIEGYFYAYQEFLDGSKTESDLENESGDPIESLLTFYDKLSYAYGYVLQFNLQNQGLFLDLDYFNDGIVDAFIKIELPYTDEEIDSIFRAYQDKMMSEYQAMLDEFAEYNLQESETFLAENRDKEGVVTTASGLQYKVVTQGDGSYPADGDSVKVDYMITFIDGSVGDNSYMRGQPAIFNLDNLISGFSEGVKLMNEGSQYRFYVHPSLAYGEWGTDQIPPNALLIFDVELHEVIK